MRIIVIGQTFWSIFEAKHILELGPGDSVGSAIVAASFGASITLLDSGYFAKSNITFYRKLSSDLAKRGLSAPNLKDASTIEDILKLCNAKYFTEGLDSFRFIASDSVDFVFSNAVLEHVRKKIFKPQLMKHLGSWLLVGKHRIGLIFGSSWGRFEQFALFRQTLGVKFLRKFRFLYK